MPHASDHLKAIHNFNDLVLYLEERLGWPLREYGFDDLTFQYEPEELGLKDEDAAKVKAIHQLRPLQHGQPWGIFFVEFENKKLPVVVLRRILSHLVIKKRASANKANEAAWHAEDLLFVTSFGEEDSAQREIAFAHFHQSPGDMPTLRVLGWDGGDTPLKLSHLDTVLRQRLHWPDDTSDHAAWRQQWRGPFKHKIGHIIRTADALAEALAGLARGINDKANRMLAVESENGPLRKLHKAFKAALIHDLTEKNFADTYAQTITYGLLTAAISRTEGSEGRHGTHIVAENVTDMVPITNPFLKEMLQTFLKVGGRKGGIDFDELGIQDVVDLLRGDETDLPAILRDFGNKTQGEDPVIHFYEHFLAAYNKKLKVQRGVFYTPKSAVSYIVSSVHELLQVEFGLEDGLASTATWGEMVGSYPEIKIPSGSTPSTFFVMILDPATGTATFLVEVIDVIYQTMTAKWRKQGKREQEIINLWNEYIPKYLLPRLHGYELMMAPYAIAHMKIGLKLHETGYRFNSNERVRVYLTNTLEQASDDQHNLVGIVPALAHEANSVNKIKRNINFTVVVGNPPYSVSSYNKSYFIENMMELYKIDVKNEKNIQLLSDDYSKFIRFCHWNISKTNIGIVSLITKNTFINTSAFKGLRIKLLEYFDKILVFDLHGKLYEKSPDGNKDENIFDIRVGTAIDLLVKGVPKEKKKYGKLFYKELYGERNSKYNFLKNNTVNTTNFEELVFNMKYFFYENKSFGEQASYDSFLAIDEIFCVNSSGIKSGRDHFVLGKTEEELKNRLNLFIDSKLSIDLIKKKFQIEDNSDFVVSRVKEKFKKIDNNKIIPFAHKPFDNKFVYYDELFVDRDRKAVMKNFFSAGNLALIIKKRHVDKEYCHCYVSDKMVDINFLGGQSYIFPLWINKDDNGLFSEIKKSNLSPAFELKLENIYGKSGLSEMIFYYVYALLHSNKYRNNFGELLKIDYPKIPITNSYDVFKKIADIGRTMTNLHLLTSDLLEDQLIIFSGVGDSQVNIIEFNEKKEALFINSKQFFSGITKQIYEWEVGKIKPAQRFIKSFKDKYMNKLEVLEYCKICTAIKLTFEEQEKIDELYETILDTLLQ